MVQQAMPLPDLRRLLEPVLPDFCRFGGQIPRFGYALDEGQWIHGAAHSLRVLLLSLLFCRHSGLALPVQAKPALIYYSLLHDVGRVDDGEDEEHGQRALARIRREGWQVEGLYLDEAGQAAADFLIAYHCVDDAAGEIALAVLQANAPAEKEELRRLYYIGKDMDGLDRVRLGDLDPAYLRTAYAKQMQPMARALLGLDIVQLAGM